MDSAELYKAGKLQDAINAQIQSVKANPAEHAKRLFLFELLVFSGDLERARRQLAPINYTDPEIETALLNYRQLLDAEEARRKVFKDGVPPKFLISIVPEHVNLRLEAINQLRAGHPAEAAKTLAKATEAAPASKGKLNDKPFDELRDCDDILGPVLEVMAKGNYFWVPLETVESIAMNAPRFPRDLVWIPARLDSKQGESGEMFLPAMYHGSHAEADDQIKLGRVTDWRPASDNGPVLGVGSKLFMAGDDTVGILDWRALVMDADPAAAEPAAE
jgi:type VI secretion system protein ImpE